MEEMETKMPLANVDWFSVGQTIVIGSSLTIQCKYVAFEEE